MTKERRPFMFSKNLQTWPRAERIFQKLIVEATCRKA